MGEGDHNHERIERSFSHFPIILSKKNFTATAAVVLVTRSSPNANWLECARQSSPLLVFRLTSSMNLQCTAEPERAREHYYRPQNGTKEYTLHGANKVQ